MLSEVFISFVLLLKLSEPIFNDATLCTASLVVGANEGVSLTSRRRSDGPFNFPRQRRSVRRRCLNIDSDTE